MLLQALALGLLGTLCSAQPAPVGSLLDQVTGVGTSVAADVQGCDLGVVFDHGDQLLMVFGDTFGFGPKKMTSNWRSNTMVVAQVRARAGRLRACVVACACACACV
jgi:hypothetical protein